MYLSIMGRSTDEELLKYPSVHLTSIRGTPQSLTIVIQEVMGSLYGHVIHNT